jgi:hypothetical protein
MNKKIQDFIINKENTDSDFIKKSPYESGKELNLYYRKNNESLWQHATDDVDYGQNIEISGDYLNLTHEFPKNPIDMFEYGTITFKNPLLIEFKSTDSYGWKKDLSDMFKGKTGKDLNLAIKKAGYDAVITVELYKGKYYFNESVNINASKIKQKIDSKPSSKQKI